MGDMIDRDAAIGALEDRRDKYQKDSQTWLQIQLDILTIRAIPAADARAEALKEADGITPHDLFAATAPNDIPRDFMPRPLPFALPGFREGMGVSQQDRLAKEFDAKRAIAWRWHWADAMMERRANEGAK